MGHFVFEFLFAASFSLLIRSFHCLASRLAVAALIRASVLLLERDKELGDEFDPVWLTESSGRIALL